MYPKGRIGSEEGCEEVVFDESELMTVNGFTVLSRQDKGDFARMGYRLPLIVYNEHGTSVLAKKWEIIVDDGGETVLVPTVGIIY